MKSKIKKEFIFFFKFLQQEEEEEEERLSYSWCPDLTRS